MNNPKTAYQELVEMLKKSCSENKMLKTLHEDEVDEIIKILKKERFAKDARKKAHKEIGETLDTVIDRLFEENR